MVRLLGVLVKEHIRIDDFVKWEVFLTLDDLVLILAEFYSFEGEEQNLGLSQDPGLADTPRELPILLI